MSDKTLLEMAREHETEHNTLDEEEQYETLKSYNEELLVLCARLIRQIDKMRQLLIDVRGENIV